MYGLETCLTLKQVKLIRKHLFLLKENNHHSSFKILKVHSIDNKSIFKNDEKFTIFNRIHL
jgi:hypothetical protein